MIRNLARGRLRSSETLPEPVTAVRTPVFIVALLVMLIAVADAQAPADAVQRHVRDVLFKILEEEWHPRPTDPQWVDVQRFLDVELARDPSGNLATLARRAAVRVDVSVDQVISQSGHILSVNLDTRPWFGLQHDLPYVVDVWAAANGGAWFRLATGSDGAHCSGRLMDLAWPGPMGFGFHHIELIADVTFVRRAVDRGSPRCEIVTRATDTDRRRLASPDAVVSQERRTLPAMSFGWFDTRRRVRRPSEADGTWTADDESRPQHDRFVTRVQTTRTRSLDPGQPAVPFQQWLRGTLRPFASAPVPLGWRTAFCNEDESFWYRGDSPDLGDGSSYWRISSVARRRPRDLCVEATAPLGWRTLRVQVRVGHLLEETGEWQMSPPQVYAVHAVADTRAIDIPSLSAIGHTLGLPLEAWPAAQAAVTPLDLSYQPARPDRPGTITARIWSLGSRPIPHAHGMLIINPGCREETRGRVYRDFVGALGSGADSFTVTHAVTLPAGSCVGACVEISGPEGSTTALRLRDENRSDDCANAILGEPTAGR